MYHGNINVKLMIRTVIQIKSGITINAAVTAKIQKNIVHVEKIIFGILVHVLAKMVNI